MQTNGYKFDAHLHLVELINSLKLDLQNSKLDSDYLHILILILVSCYMYEYKIVQCNVETSRTGFLLNDNLDNHEYINLLSFYGVHPISLTNFTQHYWQFFPYLSFLWRSLETNLYQELAKNRNILVLVLLVQKILTKRRNYKANLIYRSRSHTSSQYIELYTTFKDAIKVGEIGLDLNYDRIPFNQQCYLVEMQLQSAFSGAIKFNEDKIAFNVHIIDCLDEFLIIFNRSLNEFTTRSCGSNLANIWLHIHGFKSNPESLRDQLVSLNKLCYAHSNLVITLGVSENLRQNNKLLTELYNRLQILNTNRIIILYETDLPFAYKEYYKELLEEIDKFLTSNNRIMSKLFNELENSGIFGYLRTKIDIDRYLVNNKDELDILINTLEPLVTTIIELTDFNSFPKYPIFDK